MFGGLIKRLRGKTQKPSTPKAIAPSSTKKGPDSLTDPLKDALKDPLSAKASADPIVMGAHRGFQSAAPTKANPRQASHAAGMHRMFPKQNPPPKPPRPKKAAGFKTAAPNKTSLRDASKAAGMHRMGLNPDIPAAPVAPQATEPAVDPYTAEARAKQNKWYYRNKYKMTDEHVGEMKSLDADDKGVNEVTPVTYKRNIGASKVNKGFFKPTPEDFDTGSVHADKTRIGMDEYGNQVDPRLGARAVASSRLDKKLKLNALTHDVWAEHNGQEGTTSAIAPGAPIAKNIKNAQSKVIAAEYNQALDLKKPGIQRGFADLQLMDYLAAQVDRHEANIFVDVDNEKVTGIDNDLSFGTKSGDHPTLNNQVNNFGLPQQVDKETATKVMAMDKKSFTKVISGKRGEPNRLEEEEIEAAQQRLADLKEHIAKLQAEDKLIDQWDDSTYQDALTGLFNEDGTMSMDNFKATTLLGRTAQSLEIDKRK